MATAAPQASDLSEPKRLIEFAAKAAENFVSAYYQATDAPHRVQLIPTLYLPDSTIVWNGHPVSGASNLAALLGSMPGSKHEVQAFDSHPIGGGTVNGVTQPPSLLLTVSGVVVHHTPGSLSAMPQSNAPKSTGKRGTSAVGPTDGSDSSVPLESLARAFSQNFVLVSQSPEQQANGGVAASFTQDGKTIAGRFFVQADTFRFVG